MTRNRIFLFGVILFLLGSVAAFYRAGAVSAVSIKEPKVQDSRSNQVKIDTQVSVPANMEITEVKSAVQVEADLSAPETFDQLNQKTLTAARSGWLHGREHRIYNVDSPNFGALPNGREIPLEQITDFWFNINDNGFIERSVTILHNTDSQVVQVGINSNGTSWNTATDEIVSHELFPFEGFDYGLHYYLTSPKLQFNHSIEQGGRQVTTFSIFVREENPVPLEEYLSRLIGMEHHYYFDTETGFFIRSDAIAHLEDGSHRQFESIQTEFELGITPPPDVLAYFEQKQVREGEK